MNSFSYQQEIWRKSFHLLGLSIPIAYGYLSQIEMMAILFPLTMFIVTLDVGRHFYAPLNSIFVTIFNLMLRDNERGHYSNSEKISVTGATPFFISALICVTLFPKLIAITAFIILVFADATAAIIGRRWGRHRFGNKSLEGTLAFIFVSLLIVFILKDFYPQPEHFFIIGSVASILASIAEALSDKLYVDDNLSIPLTIGTVMWLGLG